MRRRRVGSRGSRGRGRARAGASLPRTRGAFPESSEKPGRTPKVKGLSRLEASASPPPFIESGRTLGSSLVPWGLWFLDRTD